MTAPPGALGAPNAPILIVEDDRDLGVALCEWLTDEGFPVVTAADPDEALALLERQHVSVVVADYLFGSPDRSGQLARKLLDGAHGTPVGSMSAWAIPAELAGRYAFRLTKPVEPQDLLAAIAPHAAVQGHDPRRTEVIHRYFEALGRRSWPELGALCTERVRYHLAGTDEICGIVAGRAAFLAYTAETFAMFREARFEVTQISWMPRGAVASYRGRWRPANDDETTAAQESKGAVYFQFEGNLIASIGVRMDMAKLRALLGAESRGADAALG